jgi:periplasmic protein TonB
LQEPELLNNIGEIKYDRYDASDEPFDDPVIDGRGRTEEAQAVVTGHKDKILKYCIVASCVLHVALFTALPHMAGLVPTNSLLKPGERVTPVRLVEPPAEEKKPEPPPLQASAISDRDHTAPKERLPKAPPSPRPPLPRMEPVQQKMASLPPPMAPHDLVKPKEETPPKEDNHKPSAVEKPAPKNHAKHANPADRHTKQKSLQNPKPDLRPTMQDIATGLSAPGGSPDFFPDGDIDEAVLDINTRDDRFASYLLHLKRKIQAVWIYPSVAAQSGIGGSLTLEFSIARTGELLGVNLLDSSGHTVLDDSAVKAIKSAAPYFPFPDRMRAKKLRIKANFIYVTSNYFRSIM